MDRVGVIVPAAGRSARMAGVDKLFIPLLNRPLLAWCLDILEKSPLVAEIVVAVALDRLSECEAMGRERRWIKTGFVGGGARRQDSVANGLHALGDVHWVLVHDGDRPFLDEAAIEHGLCAARDTGVAVASTVVSDTVKVVSDEGLVVTTLDRGALRAVQTPQVFRADIIRHAYSNIENTVTDDATLAERLGYAVRLYPGNPENLKVTTPDDLLVAEAIAGRWEART
jgi:2-C-methyl-D-erythritol 4-phosphate cytidylyltransferase